MTLYHCTTPHKLERYIKSKQILSPQKMKSKDLPKSVSWLAKVMARFGWYRQYEIIVVDSKQFGYMGSSIWDNKKPKE